MRSAFSTRPLRTQAWLVALPVFLSVFCLSRNSQADVTTFRPLRPATQAAAGRVPSAMRNAGTVFHADRQSLAELTRAGVARVMLPMDGGREAAVTVRSFSLLAEDAAIKATGELGATPTTNRLHFFRGEVEGDPGSMVVLAVGEDRMLGVLEGRAGRFQYQPAGTESGIHAVVDAERAEAGSTPFECASEALGELPIPERSRRAPEGPPPSLTSTARLICRVAVDADYEFGVFLGGVGPATDNLLVTLAIMSSLYERDVNVALQVTYLNVWATSSDPYTSSTVDGRLFQFQSYWNANRTTVTRDVALLACRGVSGPGPRGVAWLNGLIIPGYSYAAAFFDGTSALSLGAVHTDAWTMGHELGHLLGSSHTHSCFWQAHGFLPTGALIDSCYPSGGAGDADPDRTGACFLPPGIGQIVPPDKGTVMSYCHTVAGGWPRVRMKVHAVCAQRMRQVTEPVLAESPVQPPVLWETLGSGNGALVAWDPSPTPGVIRYDVYRTTLPLAQNPVFLGSVSVSPWWWVDPWNFGMSAGNTYRVKAVTGSGESSFSADMTVPVCLPMEGVASAGIPAPPGTFDEAKTMALGDFNEDGVTDVAVVSGQVAGFGNGRLAVALANAYEGFGDGTFQPPTVVAQPGGSLTDIDVDDFNDDGILDLVITDEPNSEAKVYLGQGTGGVGNGGFSAAAAVATAFLGRRVAVADFNEDGIRDLAVGGDGELAIHLGLGSGGVGNGQFSAPTFVSSFSGLCSGLATGDFNEDGIVDLAIAESTADKVWIALGTGSSGVGSGSFALSATGIALGSDAGLLSVTDLNLDGRSDLVVVLTAGNSVAALLGQGSGSVGNGTFGAPATFGAGTAPRSLCLVDWYNDGIPDVVVATPTSQSTRLNLRDVQFLAGGVAAGTANGTFEAPVPAPSVNQPLELAAGDFNTDGLPDLLVLDETKAGGQHSVGFFAGTCSRPISKTLTVQVPNGGQTWFIGSDYAITWSRAPGVLAVDVELSRDGGTNWETLARNVSETSLTWRAVPPASATARVRIVDPTVRSRKDLGNANFAIAFDVTPPAAITSFDGGAGCYDHVFLSWYATGDDGTVGTASAYDLRWSNSTITEANFSTATSIPIAAPLPSGQFEQVTVSVPTCSAPRYYAIKARDEMNNWSALSNVAYTGPACPHPPIQCEDAKAHLQPKPGEQSPAPSALEFAGPTPNPVTAEAIRFRLGVPSNLAGAEYEISIFDVAGRRLALVASGAAVAGQHTVSWAFKERPGAGLYFARLRIGSTTLTRTVVVAR